MTKYLDLHGQLLGEYRLVQWLGGGRYGDVYLGQHIHHQAQAAIKVFNASLKEQEQQSFLQEAQALQLEHSHIAPLLDTGIATNDLPYVVMEYATHGTLRKQYIRGLQQPLATILAYIMPLASALHHAHTQDLIHGNVKPENVLLDDNQTIRLSDFSIATITSRMDSSQKASPYVAPEQLLGEPDTASDQYALAVMVYEWLSGKYPFQEAASSTPQSLCEQIPDLPAEIEQILFKALAQDPGQRFASVQAFAAALEAASYEEQSPTAPMPTASLMTKKLAINVADTPEETSEQEDAPQEAVSPLAAPEAETTELETLPAPPTIASVNKRHILAITVVAIALLIVASSIFLPPIRNMQITNIPLKIQQNYLNAQETTAVGKMPGAKPSPAITPTPTPTQKSQGQPTTYPTPTPTPKPAPTSKPKPTPTPKRSCPPLIQSGSTGTWVKTLQKELNARGMKGKDGKPLDVDGEFGPNTEYAVKAWQTKQHIEVDGQVGPITWHTLGNC